MIRAADPAEVRHRAIAKTAAKASTVKIQLALRILTILSSVLAKRWPLRSDDKPKRHRVPK
jgi:hypothetical protein